MRADFFTSRDGQVAGFEFYLDQAIAVIIARHLWLRRTGNQVALVFVARWVCDSVIANFATSRDGQVAGFEFYLGQTIAVIIARLLWLRQTGN